MASDTAGPHSGSVWLRPFLIVLIVQIVVAFMMQLLPITAPVLVEARGWSESAIGYLMAGLMISAIICLLATGRILNRLGPLRTLQLALILAASGAAILALPLLLAPVLTCILFGVLFGPNTPAGSEVLQRVVPNRHRALLFSIKQAGVSFGAATAGLILPPLILWGGLTFAAGFTAVLLLACAVLVQTSSGMKSGSFVIGPDRAEHHGFFVQLAMPFRALKQSLGTGQLAVVGGLLSAGQGMLNSFLMIYLVMACGFDLALAGVIFACMQAGGVIGRILFGWLSDRLQSGLIVLRFSSVMTIGSMIFLACAGQSLGPGVWFVMALIVGMVSYGWNGVLLSEVARRAPTGLVADATAGAVSLVLAGMMVGPATFALIHSIIGRFDYSFAVFVFFPVIACVIAFSIPSEAPVN